MFEEKKCDHNSAINGVSCDVTECVYHNGVRSCTADCICVECKETEHGKKTQCGTFQKK